MRKKQVCCTDQACYNFAVMPLCCPTICPQHAHSEYRGGRSQSTVLPFKAAPLLSTLFLLCEVPNTSLEQPTVSWPENRAYRALSLQQNIINRQNHQNFMMITDSQALFTIEYSQALSMTTPKVMETIATNKKP
eukprot:1160341-Pelagomonas_calceolata.AAC.5